MDLNGMCEIIKIFYNFFFTIHKRYIADQWI